MTDRTMAPSQQAEEIYQELGHNRQRGEPMKRWQVSVLVLSLIAVLTWVASDEPTRTTLTQVISGKLAGPIAAERSKPVCDSPINPNVAPPTDCVPQYVADLPPDPGAAGLKTVEGIDADRDGVRDDVQRFIAINYGHSQRASKALTLLAKSALHQVQLGDSVSPSDAFELVSKTNYPYCYARSVDEKIVSDGALEKMHAVVANTPARHERIYSFAYQVSRAGQGFLMPDFEEPLENLCGYDPAKLPN